MKGENQDNHTYVCKQPVFILAWNHYNKLSIELLFNTQYIFFKKSTQYQILHSID